MTVKIGLDDLEYGRGIEGVRIACQNDDCRASPPGYSHMTLYNLIIYGETHCSYCGEVYTFESLELGCLGDMENVGGLGG